MGKKEYGIKEITVAKKSNALAFTCFSAAAILLLGYYGGISVINKNKDYKYSIDYGQVKVSGEEFDKFDKSNIKVIKTTSDGNRIAIEDSNKNYWVVNYGSWYIIYTKVDGRVSLINDSGYIICGTIEKIDDYLNDEEKKNDSFNIEELKRIEGRINNKDSEIILKRTL